MIHFTKYHYLKDNLPHSALRGAPWPYRPFEGPPVTSRRRLLNISHTSYFLGLSDLVVYIFAYLARSGVHKPYWQGARSTHGPELDFFLIYSLFDPFVSVEGSMLAGRLVSFSNSMWFCIYQPFWDARRCLYIGTNEL